MKKIIIRKKHIKILENISQNLDLIIELQNDLINSINTKTDGHLDIHIKQPMHV